MKNISCLFERLFWNIYLLAYVARHNEFHFVSFTLYILPYA